MSFRPAAEAPGLEHNAPTGFKLALGQGMMSHDAPAAATAQTGNSLRTVADSPYNDRRHLTPKQFEDHDGGPWNDVPKAVPRFVQVPNKWVVGPTLGAATPALALFPKRNSNRISFAPDVHLEFATVWTPIVARFSQLFLVDVDKKGNMPSRNQEQHWIATFRGKTDTGITACVIRIRVNNTGDQLEGARLPSPPSRTHSLRSDSSLTLPPLVWQAGPSTFPTPTLSSPSSTSRRRPRRSRRSKVTTRLWSTGHSRPSTTSTEGLWWPSSRSSTTRSSARAALSARARAGTFLSAT